MEMQRRTKVLSARQLAGFGVGDKLSEADLDKVPEDEAAPDRRPNRLRRLSRQDVVAQSNGSVRIRDTDEEIATDLRHEGDEWLAGTGEDMIAGNTREEVVSQLINRYNRRWG